MNKKPLHICFVAYEYSKDFPSPEALLEDYFSLTGWCDALASEACKVSALVRFKEDGYIQRKEVDYYFISDEFGPKLSFWQIPKRLHKKLPTLRPDIVHTHNMNKVLQHKHLLRTLNGTIPMLIQNHAETPKYWLRSRIQQHVFKHTGGFLFCAEGQEKVWLEKRIIAPDANIFFAMEGSTDFKIQARPEARRKTGMEGDPVFLWVGNLNQNKDPLTVLTAFNAFLQNRPEARLYMIYRFDDLLEEVRDLIRRFPALDASVKLIGSKKREELEDYYNSADYFLLGSHREGSGYALMESLACGCIPIVTDIPSFRMMTDTGKIGPLWPPGDQHALRKALEKAIRLPLETSRQAARAFFEKELSYGGIIKKMLPCYRQLSDRSV